MYGWLAGLLWMDIVRANGIVMTPRRYARVGLRVGLPALVVALPLAVLCSTRFAHLYPTRE